MEMRNAISPPGGSRLLMKTGFLIYIKFARNYFEGYWTVKGLYPDF